MGFVIREAVIDDVQSIFDLIFEFSQEFNEEKSGSFKITKKKLITDSFEENAKINFIVAEFNEQIFGYLAYHFSYDIFTGRSITIEDLFVQKDFRQMEVAVFLFSKLINVSLEEDNHLIRWVVDILDEKIILTQDKMGISVDKDNLILNIYNINFPRVINTESNTDYTIRFAVSLDFPDIFELIKQKAKELDVELVNDIYKLIADGFSDKPQYKILIAVDEKDQIIAFLSFFDAYSTFNGKAIIINHQFVDVNHRNKGLVYDLIKALTIFAYKNDYERLETLVNKSNIKRLEHLKSMNILPYGNLRVSSFIKEDYKKILQE